MSLEIQIKRIFQELGFDLAGITTLSRPAHTDAYLRWLELGLHAGMAYMDKESARQRRAEPSRVLPGARSVVVAGLRYSNPDYPADPPTGKLTGKVASYAWSEDYHLIIPPLLQQAVSRLEALLGRPVSSRIYTDTGPVLERDFAAQAGLGWIGKNTCLISPQHGSYFLLSEAFLDVDLTPDEPFTADRCGSCTRCIDACPTECIRPDRTIDSARCISYLTIENKGAIPVELREPMGDWIFGCDVCQQVCPWNLRFAGAQGSPLLSPRAEAARPSLEAELRLSPEEFNRKFKRSPVLRARRRGYLRNVAVALGNSRDERAVPALALCLENEPEALVRAHAAWSLGRFQGALPKAVLQKAAEKETDPSVLGEIQATLGG